MLLNALQAYGAAAPTSPRAADVVEHDVNVQFESILAQHESGRAEQKAAPSLPTFFVAKPKANTMSAWIRKEARVKKEQMKSEVILDDLQQQRIEQLLEEYVVPGSDFRINYDGFSQAATVCKELFGPHVGVYFKASVFQKLDVDEVGCISAALFMSYLNMRCTMQHMRVHLAYHDSDNVGELTDLQLQEYIRAMIPELPSLAELQTSSGSSFVQHYQRITARKLMFFYGKNGKCQLRTLVNSLILQELTVLKSKNLAEAELMANWFSLQSTRRVYNTFLALDEDMNGMLSRPEFSAISNGTMSPLFIKRIFECHVMHTRGIMGRSSYSDEMDLMSFTDFVLAWDHRSHVSAIKYFFPIFDLKGQGYVTPLELYSFFKEIHVMWVEMGEYADLAIYDVVDEILDMVKPKTRLRITMEDLEVSKQSGIFFSILSDVKQFYEHNYRENQIAQDDANDDK